MRKILKGVIIGLTVIAALFAGAIAWLAWEIRPRPPDSALPAIAKNLPGNVAEADGVFKQRALAQFPDGLTLPELRARLSAQGFKINESHHIAVFSQESFPCDRYWDVAWEENGGRAEKLVARYSVTCT